MPDFNLSAEIALQLAKNSIASLKKDIQKAFNNIAADVDVDASLNKAQKAAYKKVITIPAILDFNKANTDIANIEKKIKPIKIKVELDKAFMKKNFSQKAFQEYVDNLGIKPTLKIGVEFDKESQKALNKLSLLKKAEAVVQREALKQQNAEKAKAQRKAEAEEKAASKRRANEAALKFDLGGFDALGNELGKQAKGIRDFTDLIEILAEESDQLNKSLKNTAAQATFFQNASKGVKNIIASIGGGDEKQGIVNLTNRFQGLTGEAKNNLVSAVKIVFRAVSDIEDQEARLARTLNTVGKDVSIASVEISKLKNAKQTIVDLFNTFDAVDPSVFSTRIKSATRDATESTGNLIRNLTTDISRYNDLINTLESYKKRVQFGGSDQAKGVIQSQIDLVKNLRGQNKSVRDIKADDQFQINSATLKALGFVDITFGRIENTFSSLRRKAGGDIGQSIFGNILDVSKKVDDVVASSLVKIRDLRSNLSGQDAVKVSQDIRGQAGEEINALFNRVEKLNQAYAQLQSIQNNFNAAGFTQSANAVEELKTRLIDAGNAGERLDVIVANVDRDLAKINIDKGIENRVNNVIRQIERMKITLGREADGDITGVVGKIEKLKGELQTALTNKSQPLTFDSLDQISTKGIFDIRQGEKVNRFVENTAHKLRLLGDAQDDLAVEAKYDIWATNFEKEARKVVASTGSVTAQINKLKVLSDQTFVSARIDADGGFFGTVSKAAGLAAKRLGAFLILAQGLYGIQAQITQSIRDAVVIDKEFVKLDQVITGGLGGAKLEVANKNLKDLKVQILGLGSSLGVLTTEVAQSAQVLAQAGLAGKELKTILDVVTKSQLGPSFASSNETSEAAIAIMQQFNLTAKQTADALGGVNRLSARYAVEAGGITEAVRRAGGVFSTAGGSIDEFAAAFTIVKEQTREADESIATALRNMTQRIQRSRVQQYLKDTLNIDLVDQGKFIGFTDAITKIGDAIKRAGIDENSPLFSEIREKLAGTLQAGRITPLLQNYEELIDKAEEFRKGSKSIEEDTAKAFGSIENKLLRAKNAVTELFAALGQNEVLKFLIEGFTQITITVTNMLKAINTLPGAILAVAAAFKAIGPAKGILQAIGSQFVPRALNFATKRNSGGLIPGGGPNKDSVLSYLTKGEYVIQRPAVDALGKDFFDQANKGILPRNKGGIIPGFNTGGLSGGGGFLSLFSDAFTKIAKKLLGFGDIVEKTTQEIATGVNLPQVFSDAIKPRSSAIDINPTSYKRDISLGIIKGIKEAGAFKDTSGDKNLPVFGKPELPSNIMDGIIADALKSPKTNIIKDIPYKGNSQQLRNLSKDAGIDIPESLFKKLFKGVTVVDKGELKGLGSFNKRDKVAKFTEGSILDPRIVSHEIGHGLEPIITGKLKSVVDLISSGPLGDRTRGRMDRSGNYGASGSAGYEKKYQSEIIGDIFKYATASKSGTKVGGEKETQLLNLFTNLLKKQTGIVVGARSKQPSDVGLELSGILNDLKLSTTERALGAGVRLPGSLNQPLNEKSQNLIDLRNNRDIRNSSSSPNFIDIIKRQGGFKGSSGSKGPLGGGFPNFSKAGTSISGFTSSLLTSKKSLAIFGGSLVAIAATVASLDGEFGQLASAIAISVSTMLAASKTGSFLNTARDSVSSTFGIGDFGAKSKRGIINRVSSAKNSGGVASALTLAKELAAGVGKKNLNPSKYVGAVDPSIIAAANARKFSGAKSTIDLIKSQGPAAATKATATASAANLAKFGKNLNLWAIGVGVATGIITHFADATERAGIAALENAKNQDDAVKASASIRRGKIVKGGASVLGGTAAGALTGASIGSFVPVIGTTVGAILGGIGGFFLSGGGRSSIFKSIKAKLSSITKPLESFFEAMGDAISNAFDKIGDSIYVALNGFEALVADKASAALSGRQNFTKNRLQRVNTRGGGAGNGLNNAELSDTLATLQVSQGVIQKAGGVDKLNVDQNSKIKEDLQKVSEIYTALPESERAKILDAAKRSGIDLTKLFTEMDLSILDAKVQASAAFESMSQFLAQMKQTVDLTSARLSGFEAGLSQITDPSSKGFVPDQFFDIIGKGFDPKKLGLNQFEAQMAKLNAQVNAFDPNLSKAVGFQVRGQQAARGLQGAVASDAIKNINFQTEGNKENALQEVLSNAFDAATGGDDALNAQFDKFIESKIESLGDAFGNNQVLGSKVNEMLEEFAGSLDQGALDQVKRLNDINKSYYNSYLSLMQERLNKEKEITDLVSSNIDKGKSRFDIQNKSRGLTGDKLLDVQRNQASIIDNAKKSSLLRGTGINPNASPQQLGQALVQSQVRGRGFQAAGNAEGQAAEEALQSKLIETLKYAASGGETATIAMQAFDRAAEKAASSSKFLTDTLLGTDEQIIDTYKGIAAFQQIRSAGSTDQARAIAATMSEGQRSALNSYLGQNQDARQTVEDKLGFGSSIVGSREAQAVDANLANQQGANDALIKSLQDQVGVLNGSSEDLKKFYAAQFQNAMTVVNAANESAKNLVNQIGSLPNVISHEGNITVTLVGAEALAKMNESMKAFVDQQISHAFMNLEKENQGIKLPTGTGLLLGPLAGVGNLL